MTGTGWRSAAPLERALEAARAVADHPSFLIALAGADLFLLMPDESAVADPGDAGPVWALSSVEGCPCLVAFTSLRALTAVLGGPAAHRRVRIAELAATWPDPAWQLAVDPGLPIEAFLDVQELVELAALSARPADERESRLLRAVEADDIEGYVALLMDGDVLLPLIGSAQPSPAQSLDVTDPDFAWYRLPPQALGEAVGAGPADDDHTSDHAVNPDGDPGPGPIPAFTSDERLRDLLGDNPAVEVPFALVVHAWPDDSDLLVDPGAAHGGAVAGAAMEQLRSLVRARLDSPDPPT